MTDVSLSLVCALARNRVIGRDNQLPWRLPRDLAYFKKVTLGHPIVMGRKTFESIGRPLPGRSNIVVTRQRGWAAPGVAVVNSLDEALARGRAQAEADGVREVMLIGGASLYEQGLALASRLYLTEVQAEVAGDAHFPVFSKAEWHQVSREDVPPDDANPLPLAFVVYEKL